MTTILREIKLKYSVRVLADYSISLDLDSENTLFYIPASCYKILIEPDRHVKILDHRPLRGVKLPEVIFENIAAIDGLIAEIQ